MQATTWKLTTYGKVIQLAELSVQAQRENPVSFADDKPWEAGKQQGRPTEWQACFLWRHGYLPGYLIVDDTYWTLPRKLRNFIPDWKWVNSDPNPHPKEKNRQCCECREWKPLDLDHWYKDPKGRNGWHTICVECHLDMRMERSYAKKIAA